MTWTKGQSGNPKGRARKGKTLTDILERELRQKDPDGVSKRDRVARALIDLALAGEVRAMIYIFDRIDGKPREQPDDNGGQNIELTFKLADKNDAG